MTAPASVWLTIVEELAGAWAALPGYRAAGSTASATATVYVGGQVDDEGRPDSTGYVVVAFGGEPGRPTPSGDFRQTRGPMSAGHPRDEQASIRIRLVAQPGDGGILAAAATVEGYLHDLESLLATSPDLGLSAPVVRRLVVELDRAGSWGLRQTVNGPQAVIDASVTYTARLGV